MLPCRRPHADWRLCSTLLRVPAGVGLLHGRRRLPLLLRPLLLLLLLPLLRLPLLLSLLRHERNWPVHRLGHSMPPQRQTLLRPRRVHACINIEALQSQSPPAASAAELPPYSRVSECMLHDVWRHRKAVQACSAFTNESQAAAQLQAGQGGSRKQKSAGDDQSRASSCRDHW